MHGKPAWAALCRGCHRDADDPGPGHQGSARGTVPTSRQMTWPPLQRRGPSPTGPNRRALPGSPPLQAPGRGTGSPAGNSGQESTRGRVPTRPLAAARPHHPTWQDSRLSWTDSKSRHYTDLTVSCNLILRLLRRPLGGLGLVFRLVGEAVPLTQPASQVDLPTPGAAEGHRL